MSVLENHYLYSLSGSTVCLQGAASFSEKISSSQEELWEIPNLLKRVAIGLIVNLTLPIFCKIGLAYQGLHLVYYMKKSIQENPSEDIQARISQHAFYFLKDIFSLFFSSSLSFLFVFTPKQIAVIDRNFVKTVEEYFPVDNTDKARVADFLKVDSRLA